MKGFVYSALVTLAFIITGQASGRIITVDNNGPADYSTIQAAIDASINGDEIVVSEGTYSGEGNIEIDFDGRAIVLRSQNGPEQTVIYVGEGHGFIFSHKGGPDCIIDGFTVTGGRAGTGSGFFIVDASPTIKNCIIRDCTSTFDNWPGSPGSLSGSSAVFCYGGYSKIINCVIANNTGNDWGAGLNLIGGTQTVINCTITGNRTGTHGAGIYTNGGDWDRPVILNSILWGNTDIFGVQRNDSTGYYEHCVIGNTHRSGRCVISVDPLLDGYRLMPDSPCIDAGTDGGVYIDIEGMLRPFDVPNIDNNGSLPDFDIGAYEYVANTIELTTPNGGEVIEAGTVYPITWESTGDIAEVVIEYSIDNGTTWFGVEPPNTGNTGSYDWYVPVADSNKCLVQISIAAGAGVFDVSNAVFTIEQPIAIIETDIDIKPSTLNLNSKGRWITCHIWLPDDYNAEDMDSQSLLLQGTVSPDWVWFDDSIKNVVKAKFSRAAIEEILTEGDVELIVTGEFTNGDAFIGSDIIKVIDNDEKALLVVMQAGCNGFPEMDFSEDCIVNLEDYAMFAAHWLECNREPQEACWE